MKILMIHPHDIYSRMEPWTTRVVHLAKELTKRNHEIKLVYCLRDGQTLPAAGYRQDFPFETIPMLRYSFSLIQKMKMISELARWCEVVHFQKCFPWAAIPAVYAAYKHARPLHYDWDDWEYEIFRATAPSSFIGRSIDSFERLLPLMVDTISVASQRLRALAIERGFPATRIFEGHVGADLERFHPSCDGSRERERYGVSGPLVMYMGQLSGAQYAEQFLLAAKEVHTQFEIVRFMVVGGGDHFGKLVRHAKDLGFSNNLIFTNAVSQKRIPFLLAAADVTVACFEDNDQQASKSPLKIAEYMAAGKAVVASAVGEVPRMLGDGGLLVKPGDPSGMAHEIALLLQNEELRAELGMKARRRAEDEYNWGRTAEYLVDAYQTAIAGYRAKNNGES